MRTSIFLAHFGVLICSLATCIADPPLIPAGYRVLFQTHFDGGLDEAIGRQAATPDSLAVVDAPGGRQGRSVRVTMNQTDDFSKVANGSPRVELAFARQFHLEAGKDYLVEWSTFLPHVHAFDAKQPESIAQIHQSASTGSPPFMLYMKDDHYRAHIRGGPADRLTITKFDIGSADADRGKWIAWRLHYVPDSTGAKAILQLSKNGTPVAELSGKPNAYADDTKAYWKMGIYKWAWKRDASDVVTRTVFYGDLLVMVKE